VLRVIEIEPARTSDRLAIEALLEANLLPTDGFELALGTAVIAREGGRIVGCAAVEPYGSVGLLRSACVAPPLRGLGLGSRLVDRAEAVAAARGIAELFLLTETAANWFARRGYEPDARESRSRGTPGIARVHRRLPRRRRPLPQAPGPRCSGRVDRPSPEPPPETLSHLIYRH
jgi:amino-acid N-acetyltransferase